MQSRWNLRYQLSKCCLQLHDHPVANVNTFGDRKGVGRALTMFSYVYVRWLIFGYPAANRGKCVDLFSHPT